MRNPRAVKREERARHAEHIKTLRAMWLRKQRRKQRRKLYEEVKLEWSMRLQLGPWQDFYDELMRDYKNLLDGRVVDFASLRGRSHSLMEWIRHTNDQIIEYDRMHVKKREWHYQAIVNGHMRVFGDVNGIRSLEHLEARVAQISGVIRTRLDKSRISPRPCLTVFVTLTIPPGNRNKMLKLIKECVNAENAGFSLGERQRADRYDYVDIEGSPAISSLRFDVARYDSLDISKSTAFQRFRRRRKHKERKPPDISTIHGRLRIVLQNRTVFKHWIRTGETPYTRKSNHNNVCT